MIVHPGTACVRICTLYLKIHSYASEQTKLLLLFIIPHAARHHQHTWATKHFFLNNSWDSFFNDSYIRKAWAKRWVPCSVYINHGPVLTSWQPHLEPLPMGGIPAVLPGLVKGEPHSYRLNMEVRRSPKFLWAPSHSCTHWLRPRNFPPLTPHLDSYFEGAIGQQRYTTSLCNPLVSRQLTVLQLTLFCSSEVNRDLGLLSVC